MQAVQMITPQMLRGPPPGPRPMAPVPRGSPGSGPGPRTYYNPRLPQQQQNRAPGSFMSYRQRMEAAQNQLFDGKRMRKAVHRKTVDYNSSVIKYLENRIWQRDFRDFRQIQPDRLFTLDLVPPSCMLNNPMNSVTTKFVRTSTNKFRCPIFCLTWTPEGRRLVTGASSGEFTLWNGLTFNFETILQAHDTSVRAMQWSHNDQWMVTADHAGFIKYWQTNMNNVKMYQGHKEAVRGISFCPTDTKFTTCSDDGTVRVWDFMRCHEEKILRGHGADVKCVDWHPMKGIIASGSKDSQQPVKLWDPKSGNSLATIHGHKSTVMSLKWNRNGNWLLTASRDHLLKLFDIRNMKEELQTFKGHKKEATAAAWHPIHESLFASGGSDGAVMFWMVGTDKEVGGMEEAHEGMVWTLAWHPLGHILASGSNDHSTKFWTRNRPGDMMRDKYNLNTLPAGTEQELLEYDLEPQNIPAVPGLGLEHGLPDHLKPKVEMEDSLPSIPGLNWTEDENYYKQQELANLPRKKIPFSRPVPRSFEMAWKENKLPPKKSNSRSRDDDRPPPNQNDGDRPNQHHPGNRGNAQNRGPPDDMRGPQRGGPNQFQGNGGPPNMPHDMDDRRGPGNNRQMGHPGGPMGPPGGHGPMGRGGPRGPPHQGQGGPPHMRGPNMEQRGGPGPDQRQNLDEDFRRQDQDFRQQGPPGPDQWQRDQPGGPGEPRDGFDPFNPHGGPPQDRDFRGSRPQGPGDEDLRFRGQPPRQDMGGGFDDRPGPRDGGGGQDVDYRFAGQPEGGFDQTEDNWDAPRGRGRGRGQQPNNMGGRGYRHGPPQRPGNEDFDFRESGDRDNRAGREQSPHQYTGREQSPHGFGGPQEGMRKRTYDEGPGMGRGGSFHGSRPEHMDSHGAKFGRHDSPGEFSDQFSGNRNQRGGFGQSPGGRGGNVRGGHRGRGGRGYRGGRGGRGQ